MANATGDDAFWLTTTQSKEVKFDTDSGDEGTVFVYVEMEPKKPLSLRLLVPMPLIRAAGSTPSLRAASAT